MLEEENGGGGVRGDDHGRGVEVNKAKESKKGRHMGPLSLHTLPQAKLTEVEAVLCVEDGSVEKVDAAANGVARGKGRPKWRPCPCRAEAVAIVAVVTVRRLVPACRCKVAVVVVVVVVVEGR